MTRKFSRRRFVILFLLSLVILSYSFSYIAIPWGTFPSRRNSKIQMQIATRRLWKGKSPETTILFIKKTTKNKQKKRIRGLREKLEDETALRTAVSLAAHLHKLLWWTWTHAHELTETLVFGFWFRPKHWALGNRWPQTPRLWGREKYTTT